MKLTASISMAIMNGNLTKTEPNIGE
jgi:hypothetical protein